MRPLRYLLPALLLLALATGTVFAQCDSTSVDYLGSDAIFANPERGFSAHRGTAVGANYVRSLRENQNVTIIQRIYTIPQFNDQPLSDDFISLVWSDLNAIRDGGGKAVLRFSYTNDQNGEDASLDQILEHIDQLTEVLQANSDVIAYVEAGFIGAWGEWYYSSHNLNNTDDRRTVLFALLDALPENRAVAIRTPYYKKAIFGTDEPLTPDSAYSGSYRSRTGAHNDCFLASADDFGTYQNIEEDKLYLHLDNRFVPQGGETCNPSAYSDCDHANSDLVYMHWSVLNKDYHPEVLAQWEDEGCMDDIQRGMGYRFRLLDATIPDEAHPGGQFGLRFAIANDGFASPYNPRNVEIILRNTASGDAWYVAGHQDPRFWYSGDTTYVEVDGGLPADFPEGEYEVMLNLPDPEVRLHNRPEYSIRLANDQVWEAETGFNSLLHTVAVSEAGCGPDYTGEDWYAPVPPITDVPEHEPVELPEQARLVGAFPNPFNPTTTIEFEMAKPGHAKLLVYNLLGEEVTTLEDRNLAAGPQVRVWNASGLASGIYILRLETSAAVDTMKVVLLQ